MPLVKNLRKAKVHLRSLVSQYSAFVAVLAAFVPCHLGGAAPFKRERLTGPFSLDEFGVAVSIPRGVVAYGPECDLSAICGSMHGFDGTLEADHDSKIQLYAELSPSMGIPPRPIVSLQDALKYVLAGIHPSGAELIVLKSESAMIGGLAAERALVRFRVSANRTETDMDVIVALRTLPAKESMLYEITFSAPRTNYLRGHPTFDLLVESFRTLPLPR